MVPGADAELAALHSADEHFGALDQSARLLEVSRRQLGHSTLRNYLRWGG